MTRNRTIGKNTCGFTLVEVLISIGIGAMLLGSMATMLYSVEESSRQKKAELALEREAAFALNRMVRAIEMAQIGFVPLGENPATVHSESVRNVLAISMDPTLDRDKDGWSDANNDRDWQDYNNNQIRDPGEPERIDEDPGHDLTNDGVAGVIGVDDDGDGQIDELMEFDDATKSEQDDDEDGWKNDDNVNGYDDDNDGSIDEDIKQEVSDDRKAGLANYDDNFDGIIDNHPSYPNGGDSGEARRDDDEDGAWNEDGPEVVVYFRGATEVYAGSDNGNPTGAPLGDPDVLYERLADADPADGTFFTTRVIATGVTNFQVARLSAFPGDNSPLFDITLTIANEDGDSLTLNRTARLGARRGAKL